jgi:hypothetical protein
MAVPAAVVMVVGGDRVVTVVLAAGLGRVAAALVCLAW